MNAACNKPTVLWSTLRSASQGVFCCLQQCALGKPAIISELAAGGGRHQLHVFLYLGNCISLFRQLAPLAPWENPCGLKQKHGMTFEKYDSVLLIVEGGCPSYSILATQFNPRQVI